MKLRTLILLCVVVAVGGTAWSQNRLSDVAGSITLKPEAIVEKDGFADEEAAAKKADHDLLASVLEGCASQADAVSALVEEARNTVLYRDDDNGVPTRLTSASLELDTRIQEVFLLRLTPPFDQPAATARAAAADCSAATDSIREELARKGVAFRDAKQQIEGCSQGLDRSLRELVELTGESPRDDEAAASAPTAPRTDDERVAAACEAERTRGDDAFDACTERQYLALTALETRSAANEMIDEMSFAGIRSICATLHPDDFVQREICETDKITAVRLDLEEQAADE
jgi:hypothetical protein